MNTKKSYSLKKLLMPVILYVGLFIISIVLIFKTNLVEHLSVPLTHLSVSLIFFFGSLIVMNLINIILKDRFPIINSFRLRMFTLCISIIFLLIIYFFPYKIIINNIIGISVIAGELFFFGTRNYKDIKKNGLYK